MKKLSLICFVLTLSLQIHAQESANYGAPKFAPEDGKKLLIIGQDLGAVGGLNSHSNGYVDNNSSHIPGGVTSYTSLPSLNGLTSLSNWGSGDVRAQSYLEDATFDNSAIVIGLYLVDALSGVANGSFDYAIKDFAVWVKGQNRPVFIRIGYEFEGSWNNYNPSQYIAAWKHIVHVFDAEGVRNASYVWQSAGLNYNNIENWYPGDEYVNWVGYSNFDGANMGLSIRNFADERGKPVMIAEATPRRDLKVGSGEGHWSTWYEPLFSRIYGNDRIKALAYINVNWDAQSMWVGQGWGDSRVEVNDFVQTAWNNEIQKEVWLTANNSLFDELNYSEWIATNIDTPVMERGLTVKVSQNYLEVSHPNQGLLQGISIWDFSGRLLLKEEEAQKTYRISLQNTTMVGVILSVFTNENQWIRKKIMVPSN
ncbi:MAG: glycoside hydrolase family 26 protein [Chitinophagales bacterium]